MLSIAAPSLVGWRASLFPMWLHVVALVLVIANVGELAGLAFSPGFMAAGAGPGTIAPPTWFLWAAGASWTLWRRHPQGGAW